MSPESLRRITRLIGKSSFVEFSRAMLTGLQPRVVKRQRSGSLTLARSYIRRRAARITASRLVRRSSVSRGESHSADRCDCTTARFVDPYGPRRTICDRFRRIRWAVFERTRERLRKRVVVAHARPTKRREDREPFECADHRTRFHPAAIIGVQDDAVRIEVSGQARVKSAAACASRSVSYACETPTTPDNRYALIARGPTKRCRTLALNASVISPCAPTPPA